MAAPEGSHTIGIHLVDCPAQQPNLQLLKQGHDNHKNDDHEDEAHPNLVEQTEVGVKLDIVAHTGSSAVHLRVNQHNKGITQSIDETGAGFAAELSSEASYLQSLVSHFCSYDWNRVASR